MLFRILGRLVQNAQSIGSRFNLSASSSHRAFQRHKPDRFAGSPHRRRHRNIQWRQTMSRQPIGPGIERTGLEGGTLVGLFAGKIAGEHIVADRQNAAFPIGPQPNALDCVRAMCRDVKDLLPGQRDFHRPLKLPRCDRRQDRVGIDPEFAAESTADERADQADVLDGNFRVVAMTC